MQLIKAKHLASDFGGRRRMDVQMKADENTRRVFSTKTGNWILLCALTLEAINPLAADHPWNRRARLSRGELMLAII